MKVGGNHCINYEKMKSLIWMKSIQESKITKSEASTMLCRLHTAFPRSHSTKAHTLSAAKALSSKRLISRAIGRQSKHVALVESTSRPANVTKVNITVLVQASNSSANIRLAASSVTTTNLRQDSLTLVGAKPGSKGNESILDVVAGALGVGARIVAVKITVHVEDDLVGRAIGILNLEERRTAGGGEGTRGCVVGSGDEDHLGLGTCLADGVYCGLGGVGPGGHCEIVRLVHQAESDVLLRCVLGRDLGPDIGELVVSWAALADDLAVPAGVVMEVNEADGAGSQTAFDKLVVGSSDGGVKGTAQVIGSKMLPADGKTVDVELVILSEMLHLGDSVGTGVNVGSAAGSGCVASEVETGNVHTSVLGLSVGRAGSSDYDSGLAGSSSGCLGRRLGRRCYGSRS
jgi:hypothetical protein